MTRLLLAVALLSGCSSGSSTTAPSDAGTDGKPTTQASCAAFAEAFCPRFAECSSFFVRFSFGDVETCKKRVELQCKTTMGAPGTGPIEATFAECTEKVKSATCPSLFVGGACTFPPGTLENGAPCGLGAQCKSEFCAIEAEGCGKCAAAPAEGTACVGGQCGARRQCTAAGVCVTPKPLGSPCAGAGECALPLSCFDGVCSNPAPLDAACSNESKSAPDCDFLAGHFCVANTCVVAGMADPGEPCGYSPGSFTMCSGSGSCATGSSPTGTCRAAALDGEPCDEKAGLRCLTPATCVRGVCRLPDAASCR